MNDNFRLYRRVRSRPQSDLRRKVLLKNFLREQMSSAPNQSTSLASNENLQPAVVQKSLETERVDVENPEVDEQQNSVNDSQESRSKSDSKLIFDFSKITELKLSQLTHVKKKSTPLSDADVKRISKAYIKDVKQEENVQISRENDSVSIRINMGKVSNDKFKELTKILKNAISNKEKGKKGGISKAKCVLKSIQTPFKKICDGGKSFKNKIASKLLKCDESFKHDASQIKRKIDLSVDNDGNCGKYTFVSGGMRFVIQTRSEYIQKTQNEEIEAGNSNINKSFKEISSNCSFSENKQNLSTLTSVSHSGTESNDGFNLERKQRHRYKSDHLVNDKERDKRSFRKHSGKRTLDEDGMVSRKRRKYNDARSQSIQTDISGSLREIKKLERANKRLREENKLLSESLSSIMADVDAAYSPYQKFIKSSPYTNSVNHFKNISNCPKEDLEMFRISNEPIKPRVSRSRSVQERAERRREIKLRLSSRSMCHRPYLRTSPKSTFRANPYFITSYTSKELPSYQPNSRVLRSLPDQNYNVTLNRKSSMPERVPPRPVLRRRASCVSEIQGPSIRRNLLSLPTEAFY